ncbi:MAG: helix-turn-helix domain-containing protein [Desulfomonilaceae bacterium]
MRRTEVVQDIRKMQFESVYTRWTERRITQEKAAIMLGVSARTFRRHIFRSEQDGIEGILDKRITQASSRRAPADEVFELCNAYQTKH